MPTPKRILYPGAYYHIISRGNNKAVLFLNDSDRYEYLRLINSCVKEFNLKIYAYVLMANHIHIFLQTLDANISEAMHRLNLEYTNYFNKKYQRTGHLFESRFKSKLVQKDRYFLAVVRYIHLNPVKAGIVGRPEDYKWSSHQGYIKKKDGVIGDMSEVFNYFGKNAKEAESEYEEFINAFVPEREWNMLDKVRNGILGDISFRNSRM